MQRPVQMREYFPDGTPIGPWFYDDSVPTLEQLGRPYRVTDYGVLDDGRLVGYGTHRELLDACGTYREIYESQFQKGDARQ